MVPSGLQATACIDLVVGVGMHASMLKTPCMLLE